MGMKKLIHALLKALNKKKVRKDVDTILMAEVCDRVAYLMWQNDGGKGKRPSPIRPIVDEVIVPSKSVQEELKFQLRMQELRNLPDTEFR